MGRPPKAKWTKPIFFDEFPSPEHVQLDIVWTRDEVVREAT